jgi:hypothetical protein
VQQTLRLFLPSNAGEVRPMWIIFSIFLVLLLLGIEFYVPPVVLFFFFIGVIVTVSFALMPSRRTQMTK